MYLKSYKTNRFAGIKYIELEFKPELNIILGPNESGKSSIINGIQATLFKDINLRMSTSEDKEFKHRFKPRSGGDSIDGSLVIKTETGNYEINKEWGEDKSIKLITPKGNIIKNNNDINKELNNILSFGESTYNNIVFAKQRELKEFLENIVDDPNFKREINDLLRKAVMELDGISIEDIEENIEIELDGIYKRWDIEKNYPQNNRGVNNPYVVGLGLVIDSYYKKEKLKIAMEKSNRVEKEFEEVSSLLNKKNKERESYNKEKEELETLEEDINTRSILDIEIKSIDKELERLMKVAEKWPAIEVELKTVENKIEDLNKRKSEIELDKTNLVKFNKKTALEEEIKNIEKLQTKIEEIEDRLKVIKNIDRDDIQNLDELKNSILRLENNLNAGELVGKLNKASIPIEISRDYKENEKFKEREVYKAKNSIRFKSDKFDFEIKLGEQDFEKLNKELQNAKTKEIEILKKLEIKNIEEGRDRLNEIQNYNTKIESFKRDINYILKGEDLEVLEKELLSLKDIEIYKKEEELDLELKELQTKEIELVSEQKIMAENLKEWEETYIDFANIFTLVGDKKSKLAEKNTILENLQSLPKEFETIEEFKSRLNLLKHNLKKLDNQLPELNSKYYDIKNELSEDTYEELKLEYIEIEKDYNRHLRRGKKTN